MPCESQRRKSQTGNDGCENPSSARKIEADAENTPLKRNQLRGQSHLDLVNFVGFDSCAKPASISFRFPKESTNPVKRLIIGSDNFSQEICKRRFMSNLEKFWFFRSSASSLTSRGLQSKWHLMFIESQSPKYSIETIMTGSLALSRLLASNSAALLSVPAPQDKVWDFARPPK